MFYKYTTAKAELDSSNQQMLSRGPVRGQLFQKAKVKSLQMTAIIVLAFIICWTPYYVLNILMAFFLHVTAEHEKAVIWIFFFGFANSMVNPMIYGAFHMCARRKKRFVSCHFCLCFFYCSTTCVITYFMFSTFIIYPPVHHVHMNNLIEIKFVAFIWM